MKNDSRPKAAAEGHAGPATERLARSKELLTLGAAVGAVGVAGATLLGATCPLCVVAAPALLGAGVIERLRARRELHRRNSVIRTTK